MQELESYVEQRVRRPIPVGSNVVAGSTPVIAFGCVARAHVATLGLNPSRAEFLASHDTLLSGANRRLATHESLHTSDLPNAPQKVIAQVVDDCNRYFEPQRNPYCHWFDQLEQILKRCGASYYDGTACHLDLVQWATDPTWRKLKPQVRAQLLAADVPFLIRQMRSENLRLFLLNGRRVVREFVELSGCMLDEVAPIEINGRKKARLFAGVFDNRASIVGWSTNLQSSWGVSAQLKEALAARVGALAEMR